MPFCKSYGEENYFDTSFADRIGISPALVIPAGVANGILISVGAAGAGGLAAGSITADLIMGQ
jgi:hypothetical protein